MLLSIIIPVYNVEPYIAKCLNSCVCQDIDPSDYEIIVVNDGTKDNSMDVVDQFVKEYNNIKVINQENKGLSSARNKGLSVANGDYVWFVDSDDWIEPNILRKISSYLNNNIDLLEIQYRNVFQDGSVTAGDLPSKITGIVTGREATLCGGVHTPAQFSVLRSNFLKEKNIQFVSGIYHEDVEFKVRALLLAEKVASMPDVCYNYLQRSNGSITSSFKLRNGLDLLFVLDSHYLFVQNFDKRTKKAVYSKLSMWLNEILLGIRKLNASDYNIIINKIKEKPYLLKVMVRSGNFKYAVEGLLLYLNFDFGLWLHSKIR